MLFSLETESSKFWSVKYTKLRKKNWYPFFLKYLLIIVYFAIKITTLTRFNNGFMNCSPTNASCKKLIFGICWFQVSVNTHQIVIYHQKKSSNDNNDWQSEDGRMGNRASMTQRYSSQLEQTEILISRANLLKDHCSG